MTQSALHAAGQTMRQYLEFMRHVRDHGQHKDDRTGTGTLSVFGYQMRFDLAAGFPLLTTKSVHTKSDGLRTAVVSARRYQRALPARARRHHLG